MDEQLDESQEARIGADDMADDVEVDGIEVDTEVDGIDPMLMERARGLLDVPLVDRAEAFDALNGDVVAALRAIEEL